VADIEKYEMVTVPDPILKEIAAPIENITEDIRLQAERMKATVEGCAIGLAANQVGILNRLLIVDVPKGSWEFDGEKDNILQIKSLYSSEREEENHEALTLINPEVIWESEEHSSFFEGCTSVPKQFAEIIRPARVRVKYLDLEGNRHEDLFEGLPSHVVQHEIDHLNGTLFIDYLSSLKRKMMIKRVQKAKKGDFIL
jgi:peptide deformylase